jgi:hypothetical protein
MYPPGSPFKTCLNCFTEGVLNTEGQRVWVIDMVTEKWDVMHIEPC